MEAQAIIGAIGSVTGKWAKQRKREERNSLAQWRRRDVMTRSNRQTIKQLAMDATEEGYNLVTDNGRLFCMVRQLMYAVRRLVQRHSDEIMDDGYFIHTVLPEYLREEQPDWADNLITDARGHFKEPHTDKEIGIGTLEVRNYLAGKPEPIDVEFNPEILFPTLGPSHRYQAILFVEKEGFLDLFSQAQIQERYDIAIMSTKGQHVVAARQLADTLCGEHGIPLLVLRDFDKSGWSMVGTFRRDSDRYEYEHDFKVIDLGLRLDDVHEWGLEQEKYRQRIKRTRIRRNLQLNGANEQEVEFIADQGLRVELNAFTTQQFIEYVEAKFAQHKIKKVIPNDDVLADAYRRALTIQHIKRSFDELKREAEEYAEDATVPKTLKRMVSKALKGEPAKPWDKAVANLAAEAIENDADLAS